MVMVLGPFYTQIDTIKSPRPIAYSFLPLANMLLWGCFFIGPESDHWLPLSLTNWLTDRLLFLEDLIDVTLACEDANSKLVEVFTVVDVDAEKPVEDS